MISIRELESNWNNKVQNYMGSIQCYFFFFTSHSLWRFYYFYYYFFLIEIYTLLTILTVINSELHY